MPIVIQYAFLEHTHSSVLPVNLHINSPKCTDSFYNFLGEGSARDRPMEKCITDPKVDQNASRSSAEGQLKPQKIQEMIQQPLWYKNINSDCF
jgi:hypothetical protein